MPENVHDCTFRHPLSMQSGVGGALVGSTCSARRTSSFVVNDSLPFHSTRGGANLLERCAELQSADYCPLGTRQTLPGCPQSSNGHVSSRQALSATPCSH